MACDRCLGSPDGCRHCGTKPLEPCPDCEDGYKYYIIDAHTDERIECSKEDFDNTPCDYRDYEECATCKGEGWL